MDGIIYSEVIPGSYDGPAFISFIEHLLPRMNPWPGPQSVLVMDNCAIHHIEEIEPLCTER